MNLSEARSHYIGHSGAASAAARQLAFAGIAVVWILATQDKVIVPVPEGALRLPLLLFGGALTLDLIQYYWLASYWGIFHRQKEKKGEQEFPGAPPWSNRLGIGCWVLKGVVVACGYVPLAVILLRSPL